ncbi:uncharacterized protein LOC143220984 [Lasioglossum baleicum]|uniref:uncharacterized protein LOC143220984 n=1 Tax=Lasioglossum baleicum TaxID=434251 RepID=UPI003FCDC87F
MADVAAQLQALTLCISRVLKNLKKKSEADITASVVQISLGVLEELWAQYEDWHEELFQASLKDAEVQALPYFVEDHYGAAVDVYVDHKEQFLDILKSLKEGEPTASSSSRTSTSIEVAQSYSFDLPEIELPTFHGCYLEWPSFSSIFTHFIIKNESLTDVWRSCYLKQCLKGEAEQMVRNIPVREFKQSWDSLRERYDNPRLLVRGQLSKLFNLPEVCQESSKDLETLYYGTIAAVGALAQAGRPVESSADWVVHLTVSKLDRQTRIDWETSIAGSKVLPSLDDLEKFLLRRIHTLEILEQHCVAEPAARRKPRKDCPLCHGRHYLLYCTQYRSKSPTERREVLHSLSLCFNCLRRHGLTDCTNVNRCQVCADKHHSTLHIETSTGPRRRRR